MKNRILHICFLLVLVSLSSVAEEIGSTTSPDGRNKVVFDFNNEDGTLCYTVFRDNNEIVSPSKLGINTTALNLFEGLAFTSLTKESVSENYSMPVGKRSNCLNEYEEATLLVTKGTTKMNIVFRAYNDGVAFRYSFPTKPQVTVNADSSTVNIPKLTKLWAMNYKTSYENHYNARSWTQASLNTDGKFCCPILIKTSLGDDAWMLLTEAEIDANGAASALTIGERKETGLFRFVPQSNMSVSKPIKLPWRVLFIGNPARFVESTLVENLNSPTADLDFSWVRPGLSSWDWGGLDGSQTKDLNVVKGFIDMAAEMEWPYFTLDDGWDGAGYALTDVTEYAKEKNVGVFIWSHQNRFQNNETQIRTILRDWHNKGFVGTKIDFFESDQQSMMQKMERILKVAAEEQMMVNFHGCTKPSGRRRTYPNHLSSEGVFGNEQYYYNSTATPANHNITLAITRNVCGAMEYTPVEFATKSGVVRHNTTWSHQLALAVIFESAIQTIADGHDNIVYSVAAPLLKVLPAAWDDTKCLEASADDYITVARRKGDDWYIGTASKTARTVEIPLSFLGNGDYTAQIWRDGTCPSDIVYEDCQVNSSKTLSINVKATGGATIRISRTPIYQPQFIMTEAESATGKNTQKDNDDKGNCSGGQFVTWIGQGNTLTSKVEVPYTGQYNITLFYISMESRDMYIQSNGGEKVYANYGGNGFSWNSDGLQQKTLTVSLKQGMNTIVFGNDNGYAPNLDRYVLSPTPELLTEGICNTAIDNVPGDNPTLFDLQGRRLISCPKGVYIRNGVKSISDN